LQTRKKFSNLLYHTSFCLLKFQQITHLSGGKKDRVNSGKQKLKFATFSPRTSKFLVKFSQ